MADKTKPGHCEHTGEECGHWSECYMRLKEVEDNQQTIYSKVDRNFRADKWILGLAALGVLLEVYKFL